MSESPAIAGELSRDQIELIKRTIAKGATDDELRLFVQVCNRLRLDPFARQIYLVKRWDRDTGREAAQMQVSIDGFRLTAQRSGGYRGQMAPMWCDHNGAWRDVWLEDQPPMAAKVGVYREGFVEPLVRVARFDSYAQKKKDGGLMRMWATMPDVMIAKCAEALALRAAFPAELSGVYTPEEMGSVDVVESDLAPVAAQQPKALPAPASKLGDAKTLDEALLWCRANGDRIRAGNGAARKRVDAEIARLVGDEEREAVRVMVDEALGMSAQEAVSQ